MKRANPLPLHLRPYLELEDAAVLVCTDPDTLRKSACPRVRRGRRVVFRREDLDAWMAAHRWPSLSADDSAGAGQAA